MVHKLNWLTLFLAILLPTLPACTPPDFDAQQEEGVVVDEGVSVHIDALQNFSPVEADRIDHAALVLEAALNSEEFRQRVLDFTWNGKQTFANNNGLTNEQIYAAIMAGRETYSDEDDHVANLSLSLYSPPFFKKWGVVGYGYPGAPQIYINRNYFKVMSMASLAGLLAHEWCHKLGFDHDYRRTAKRPYSVPYGVGSLVTEIADSLPNMERTRS